MNDKIKLTDKRMSYDGVSVVIQVGGCGADNKQRCKYLMKKLLDNQEKAIKYDKSENYRYKWISKEELESYVKLRDKLESENKQLKEKLKTAKEYFSGIQDSATDDEQRYALELLLEEILGDKL